MYQQMKTKRKQSLHVECNSGRPYSCYVGSVQFVKSFNNGNNIQLMGSNTEDICTVDHGKIWAFLDEVFWWIPHNTIQQLM
jgi:hypothetical protein